MTQLFQPPKAKQCGQYCVAMIAGISATESFRAFLGHSRATTTRHVAEALMRLGYTAAERLKPIKPSTKLPAICLLKQSFPRRVGWHWVVYNDGQIFCPDLGNYKYGESGMPKESRFTSFLEIAKP